MTQTLTEAQRQSFQSILLEHCEHPCYAGTLETPTHETSVNDSRTGDRVRFQAKITEERICALAWEASGSAVLRASCSLCAELAMDSEVASVRHRIALLLDNLTKPVGDAIEAWAPLGDAVALYGIRQFPARVHCAALPWRALDTLLHETQS